MTKAVVPSNLFTSVSSLISPRAPLCVAVVTRCIRLRGVGEEVSKGGSVTCTRVGRFSDCVRDADGFY